MSYYSTVVHMDGPITSVHCSLFTITIVILFIINAHVNIDKVISVACRRDTPFNPKGTIKVGTLHIIGSPLEHAKEAYANALTAHNVGRDFVVDKRQQSRLHRSRLSCGECIIYEHKGEDQGEKDQDRQEEHNCTISLSWLHSTSYALEQYTTYIKGIFALGGQGIQSHGLFRKFQNVIQLLFIFNLQKDRRILRQRLQDGFGAAKH